MSPAPSNFSFLEPSEPLLAKLGFEAERNFAEDPVVAILKLRQFGEVLAQRQAARLGVFSSSNPSQAELLERLAGRGLSRDVLDRLHELRKVGNRAVHEMAGDSRTALQQLRIARALGVWHVRVTVDRSFEAPPFVPPPDPGAASAALLAELRQLREELLAARAESTDQRERAQAEAARRADAEALAAQHAEEVAFWQSAAEQREQEVTGELQRLQEELAAAQKQAEEAPAVADAAAEAAASTPLSLSEADTRLLIDQQLRDAGWEADTQALTHASGARPRKGRNMAIAEWPTDHGPADYVLFAGLTPLAVVEAKRKNKNVAAHVEQAKRYSKGFHVQGDMVDPGGPWGEHRIPFAFSANGRPYLGQIQELSGIWFQDVRIPTNHARALDGWYTHEGLEALLAQDHVAAHQRLRESSSDYLKELRYYQHDALKAVEQALEGGRRQVMVAMATGTGKTKTCIGLLYRLLKAGRFRRVLFLVDRTALGEQAFHAFQDFRLEQMQSFTDIYDVKSLADVAPDSHTRLHLSTVQAMMKRILLPNEEGPPPVDQYDCIVVDECHRGYNLDKHLSETELTFRNELDYISKYRRVLEHFDAVKVGLTATPALHTREIFGPPVFEYSYRQAVVDGYLVDHEPPYRIVTALAEDGMSWQAGEEIEVYRVKDQQLDLFELEDEVRLEVDSYNRKVLTESFNRTVCRVLAEPIDPEADGKTLVFCVNDLHADLVVRLLKEAMDERWGEVVDDAIMKITGGADKHLEKIRLFKNEKYPSIAVTVDLLTTGIDVPKIVNLVFLRRVRSRILYEQMIGRATRPCDAIGKERFLIYDAVDLYSAMESYSNMKPVVTNPAISFRQLVDELETIADEEARHTIVDQFLAKLQRKTGRIKGEDLERFTTSQGLTPKELARDLRSMTASEAAAWLSGRVELADLLDRVTGDGETLLVSHHADELRRLERGYGDGRQRPEDYLEAFRTFVRDNLNEIAALQVVVQRPRDLTRQQLRELKLELDRRHFREMDLESAWRETTNQAIAASVIGFIRQAALGSPLVPYADRVDRALQRLMGAGGWTEPQRKWLERFARQMKAETVVDRAALDSGAFRAEAGGFDRLDRRVFNGRLQQVLGDLQETVWDDRQTA